MNADQDEFLTVADVANRLKLNQQTIYNWIDRGQLPAVRVGPRRVRARRSDLDALLAAGETQSRSTEADAAWTDIRSATSDESDHRIVRAPHSAWVRVVADAIVRVDLFGMLEALVSESSDKPAIATPEPLVPVVRER